MSATASAAQGRWKFAQPSGTTSWMTRERTETGRQPDNQEDRQYDLGEAVNKGDGRRHGEAVGPAEQVKLELLFEQILRGWREREEAVPFGERGAEEGHGERDTEERRREHGSKPGQPIQKRAKAGGRPNVSEAIRRRHGSTTAVLSLLA